MRNYVRNNVVELLYTVVEGLEYVLNGDEEAANSILNSGAEAIGAISLMLEQELSPKRFSVYLPYFSKLSDSYALLMTDIDDLQVINDTLGSILKSLDALIGLLRKEAEIRREIVFFPYKASMWDSLESIWKAALQDEQCFVSVVPVPYYEKDSSGNLTTPHYERDQFPDYVETTQFDEFDIEVIKPDVAYIHNPYDNNNYVTSVHPDYYSQVLKRNVKTLVYVPYYVLHTPSPLAFVSQAIALAADVIVAFSNEDASVYRKIGAKCDVAALGSPKIDRIIELERKKPVIPDEWAVLKGRKIYFLNTSLNSLLRYEEDYIVKIRALITMFEDRDDAALLWRPHPLTVTTIASLRPYLLDIYNEVEQLAKDSNRIVIDQTSDMGISMAISDAYIGDGYSSLVYLYALTGKPLFLLDFTMPAAPTRDEETEMAATDALMLPYIDGSDAWVFCASVNALCKLDLITGKAKYLSSVPGVDNAHCRYGQPVRNGDTLLFPPYFADEWAQYDIPSGTWTKHTIPDEALPVTRGGISFFTALDTDEFAIFSPFTSKAFVKYHKKSGEIEYHTNWYRSYEPYVFKIDVGILGYPSKLIGNSLYFPSKQANIVLELNVHSMKTSLHIVGNPSDRYHAIAFDDTNFWLTKYVAPTLPIPQCPVVRWNKSTGKCKQFPLQPATRSSVFQMSEFYSIAVFSGKVIVLPHGVSEIFRIDPVTEEVSLLDTGLAYKLGTRKSPYYNYSEWVACTLFSQHKDSLAVMSYYDYSLLFIDAETGKISKRKIVIDGIEHLLQNISSIPPYWLRESAFLTTRHFIEKVLTGDIPAYSAMQAHYHRSTNANSDGTCGQKIHEYIMRKLPKKRG